MDLGAKYAVDNYNDYIYSYPNLSDAGGDCTNFASQCMLASGIHYDHNAWYMYRKNSTYDKPKHTYQLQESWALTDPSPWVFAPEFKNYWEGHTTGRYRAKGSDITANPSIAWNAPITQGCVVQMASSSSSGSVGDPHHTMYITGYLNDGSNNTYLLTYHSTNTLSKSLLSICAANPNEYFLFYVF